MTLSSQLIQCFERVVPGHLSGRVSAVQDPTQVACRRVVGGEDVLLFMLHSVYSHLETAASSVRVL